MDAGSAVARLVKRARQAGVWLRGRLSSLWATLWIDYGKVDDEFRAELQERGVLGLRAVSTLSIVMPILGVLFVGPLLGLDHQGGGGTERIGLAEEAAAVMVGVLGWLLSRGAWGRRHARGLAVTVGLLMGLIATADMITSGGHTSTVYTSLVMIVLVGVAVVPLRPLSMLGFGLALTGMFASSVAFDPAVGWPPPVTWLERFILLVIVSVLGAGLTALVTRLHIKEHESRQVLAESLEALRRTQAKLIASKHAASQGRLAAALSHELNTPLAVMSSSSALIERRLEELPGVCSEPQALIRLVSDASDAAARSREALGRISELVERFGRFTQVDRAERRAVDVNGLLDDAVAVLSGSWPAGVRVVRDYGELPPVRAYPAGLSEVFGNVLGNAANAIDAEGEIRLTTRYARGYVWVQIADTGRGIDVHGMSRLFDPGFRVKDGRVQTGWGLFISRLIVHDHNGEFRINSEPRRGTEVEICLPAGPETTG